MMGVRGLAAVFAVAVAWAMGATNVAAAESPDAVWREVREVEIPRSPRAREIVPQRYRAFGLNRARLAQLLAQAPHERSRRPSESAAELQLPMPDGTYDTFRIVESPVMEPGLAAKYPEIRTWLGQGVEDPTATVRFDLTPRGFHAQVISSEGTVYVDPFQPGDDEHYIAYRKHDHHKSERMICEVTGEPIIEHAKDLISPKVASGASLRTYRLAMAATGEYTQSHGGTVVDGLAAIVTTMNRVNGLYEREVAVRMVLVANNDLIIYTNAATDPYANTSGDLAANQTNIDTVIGTANYDIGHLVGTGGGGVAVLRSPCASGSKARGLTGSSAPVADGFDVDYVAHEMGHQFGGNHTFNGSGGSCAGGNRNASTAYEPGSGVTIQAYAGICAADNVQPNSEDYFHRVSLDELLAFTTNAATGASCGTAATTGNQPPTVTTAATLTVPGRTPFTLTASGSDADGDALTYVWEQFDLGAANAAGTLDATALAGPLFRGFTPTTESSRTFPSLRYILNNANAVPATAPLPGTTTPSYMTGEVLPNASRTMNFRVTVRDNRAGGGGTNEASTQIAVSNLAGPVAVTAPNTAVTLAAGAATTVTWSVASSDLPPVLTANVRIVLSTDGGHTWPIQLVASTANDGSQSVTIPAGLATTQARVRVEAVGNIWFDVSDANFAITSPGNTPPTIAVTGSVTTRQGSPMTSGVVATIGDAQDAASALAVAVTGAPPELAVTVQNAGGSVTLSATADCTLVAPTGGSKAYPVYLRVTDSAGAVSTAEVNVLVGSNRTPTLGTYATLNATQAQTRLATPSALAADGNSNFSGASVTPTTLPGGGTVSIANDGIVTVVTGASTPNQTYVIRPQIIDSCGAAEAKQFDVVVAAPQISLVIETPVVTTGNGLVEPNECNDVVVNIRNNGNVAATGVSAVLSTSTPNITITQGTSGYPDIPSGESRSNSTAYTLSSTNALTCFSNVALSLSVTYAGAAGSPFAGTTSAPVGRAAGTNYVFTQTSTTATLPNDGVLVAGSNGSDAPGGGGQPNEPIVDVTTPFAFSIYGTSYPVGTVLRASTNGNLQFRDAPGAQDFANATLPVVGTLGNNANTRFPATAPTLFVQWDDWRMDVAGAAAGPDAGIYTKVEGTAPNRRWIIEWRGRIRGDGAATTNNNRAAIVLHEGSNSFDYIYLVTGVGAAANGAGSTIGVQSAATGTTFTQYAFNDATLTPGMQITAAIPPAICSPGSGGCTPGTPGVTVTQTGGNTAVVEGGATDSYSIVLTSAPSGNVTVAIAPDAQLTTSANLTFTPGNWQIAQNVTVTAVDDAVAEGAHSGSITHTASGGGYDGVTIAGVTATIGDNDTAGVTLVQSGGSTAVAEGGATDSYSIVLTSQPTGDVTIAVAPDAQLTTSGNLTFTTVNWNVAQNVTVTAVNDAIAEGAHTGSIAHTATGGGYTGVAVAGVTATIGDNDTAGVTLVQSGGSTAVAEGGATDTYTLQLTSQPTGVVTISVTPNAQLGVAPAPVTFDATDWNTAKPVTVSAIDDAVAEGAHTGAITHTASGGGYDAVAVAGVTASIADNDTVGVTITLSGGGTAVAEGGATDTYTIVLNSQPTAGVTVNVSPDAQLSTSGNVSFTTADWNSPKTVTVTAVDDAVAEGAHGGAIAHTATGGDYTGVAIAGVTATIGDNDTAGVVVTQSGGTTSVAEGGAGDSYTLVLTSQPTSTVTITVTPNAQVGVAPTSVSFDSTDWNTPKTVAVSAIDDGVDEGPHSGAITHSAVGGGYDAVAIAGVAVSIADNDSAGGTTVDLAVANMLTNAPVLAGKRMSWEVAVENLTAGVNVASAQFTFTLSPLLTNVAWVCVAEAGSVCPANGTGAPNHAIALNGGTGVSYVITADVPAGTSVGTPIDTLATISVSSPSDVLPANNQAATSHVVGTEFIFSNGFEDPAAGARERLGLD